MVWALLRIVTISSQRILKPRSWLQVKSFILSPFIPYITDIFNLWLGVLTLWLLSVVDEAGKLLNMSISASLIRSFVYLWSWDEVPVPLEFSSTNQSQFDLSPLWPLSGLTILSLQNISDCTLNQSQWMRGSH